MPNPKIATLVDAFTAATLNTGLWNSITGTATLDTTVDLVTLAQPTTSGTTNSFGSTALYDATSSSIYALITAVANGNGTTKTALVLRVDANNSVAIRVESGTLKLTLQTAGSTTTTTLGIYDGHAHRWWRLRESVGTWYADTSADGITWNTQASSGYSWAASATALTFAFQTSAGATEVSGLTGSISCINIRLGGLNNPNWPLLEDAWGPYWRASSAVTGGRFTEVTPRTRGTVGITRGRQYELDQVRAGELSAVLANTDGVLDPTNTSGPFTGNIAPYQPYRRRAQWPATVNVLSQVMATGGDLGGLAVGASAFGSDVFSDTDLSGSGTVTASSSSWQGATVLQFGVLNGTAVNARLFHSPQPAVLPGQAYTLQLRVRNVTASTSLQVKAAIGWYSGAPGGLATYTYSSATTLTGSTTAAWSVLTITATAPAGATGVSSAVAVAATAGATCVIQVDGMQLEKASTATAWVTPGSWYPMYAGYVERWPSSWRDGVYGSVAPTCVDAFALLSQVSLSDPLTQEINSHNPRFLYKLDDPQGSASATDSTGNYPAAPIAISKYGAGGLAFGAQVTAANPVTGVYSGSSGTVVTIDNPNPGTALISPASFLSLSSAGISGPADPTLWTRMVAFRYTGPTPANTAHIWSAMDSQRSGGTPSGSQIAFVIVDTGKLQLYMYGPTGFSVAFIFPTSINAADGNWHLATAAYNAAAATMTVTLDGSSSFYTGVNPALTPTGIVGDNLGNYVDITVGNGTILNYKGDIAFAGEFPSALTSTQAASLYTAWKSAFVGDSTNARYDRILAYAGWSGPKSIQSGLTTSMGAADFGGQDALSALQGVVDTEGGAHYVDRAGVVTFRARSARYNALIPQYTFGERVDLGEFPYEDCKFDFDPTRLSNVITVTQKSTGQVFTAQDQASIASYFPRPLRRTLNTSSTAECQDAANYLLSRYKQPVTRLNSLTLHPSAQPALWPVLLSMELGTRVRVMRRPPGTPAIQVDVFVEAIGWQMDDKGEARATLQCSPVDTTPYGLFGSWHTTLKTSVGSGVTSIVVNASADTSNPLGAQLGVGQQIVLSQGSVNQETATVAAVSTTTTGWTSATLTLTAATTKAHTAGDVICEPLSAGITDPATWDPTSQFDTTAFAY